jgi:hypothetical protein
MRGASGDSTVSFNFALGVTRETPHGKRFNELWRTGFDTEELEEGRLGTRFILTASGVKTGDSDKAEAFKRFRKMSGLMPQRLLGLVGLYAMRELKPSYAVALSLDGAINLSSLGKSRGICDYDGIFRDVGFRDYGRDSNWLSIPHFDNSGFGDALYRANLNSHEVETLDMVVHGLRQPRAITPNGEVRLNPPTELCSDNDPSAIEQELHGHLPRRMY